MITKLLKWSCIAALLMAALFWRSAPRYQIVLDIVICVGAWGIVPQALRARAYGWATAFVLLGVLFNPIVPVFRFAGLFSMLLVLGCIAPFAISLAALKTAPLLSVPSITGRNPGSESL